MKDQFTICVLDDEPIVCDRLKSELEEDGYEVEIYTDSATAIKRLDEKCFDIVITDLKMEGVDGMGFLEKVKECCDNSEIIMITGYATIESVREAFVRGAYDVIAKPFRVDDIRKVVKKASKHVRKSKNQ